MDASTSTPAQRDLPAFCETWNAVHLSATAGTVDASVLRLLTLSAALTDAHAAVEVGTHGGATGLALFDGMHDDGVLTSVEADPERLRVAKETLAGADIPHARTRLIAADPAEVLGRLTDDHYDLFISGDDPAQHGAFAEQAARLLRPGGMAIFLNVADAADPSRREPPHLAVRQFTENIQADERWMTTMLPLADGVVIAVLRD